MSNVKTVQGLYEAFGRGDIPAIMDTMSDHMEWEQWSDQNTAQEAGVPWMMRRTGKDGVAEFFQAVADNLEFHSFQPVNILEGGNQVAATISFEATAKETGERFRDEEIHLWTFDDAGKIVGMRHYNDTAKHIRAAKGSPAGVA
jgi:uncharacterized protein